MCPKACTSALERKSHSLRVGEAGAAREDRGYKVTVACQVPYAWVSGRRREGSGRVRGTQPARRKGYEFMIAIGAAKHRETRVTGQCWIFGASQLEDTLTERIYRCAPCQSNPAWQTTPRGSCRHCGGNGKTQRFTSIRLTRHGPHSTVNTAASSTARVCAAQVHSIPTAQSSAWQWQHTESALTRPENTERATVASIRRLRPAQESTETNNNRVTQDVALA